MNLFYHHQMANKFAQHEDLVLFLNAGYAVELTWRESKLLRSALSDILAFIRLKIMIIRFCLSEETIIISIIGFPLKRESI